MGQVRCAGPDVRPIADLPDRAHQNRSGLAGLHQHQGASGWHWRIKKTAHNPSGNRAADGTPKFIWLPQMLEQPSRSD
ncbi:hypothetical protein PXO_06098 [Xanthomonas oryzae pv. oryzae PXO99A]|uniref:Uncharacterized protein n=1 Tax=Xanthomonas oryzae pv. oryzae (strain PXO99A) TaxID=360094 RepID=A0A0J9WWS8_XANOP|nr:hypothetical protein PXO_00938 [Xanthomonas oryzae pv. oryzae PXO99A]ACD59289.1 hypothetical protein PXO_06098 [Xanthomonas oryzae pv. oryzae PXO99A]